VSCHRTARSQARARRWCIHAALTCLAVWTVGITTASAQQAAPRLREGALPAPNLEAFGSGEVVLELAVDPGGSVVRVDRVRSTPPYDDALVRAVGAWRFEPATNLSEGRTVAVASQVLLVALFRPPALYAGPAPGAPPEVHGLPSVRLPNVASLVVPAYPPTATGDASVLVEIELSAGAGPSMYRILSPTSAFDEAALDAVRAWRFSAPRAPDAADPLFVYAVLGFRGPVVVGRGDRHIPPERPRLVAETISQVMHRAH
jgi:TonB family protein